mmetsp:Transcript_132488/g.264401  ORF Transcript_132488/g.264401 Transcript_132488/m.264401 type:complete len:212 (+) Transcript_132488:68-703(+)
MQNIKLLLLALCLLTCQRSAAEEGSDGPQDLFAIRDDVGEQLEDESEEADEAFLEVGEDAYEKDEGNKEEGEGGRTLDIHDKDEDDATEGEGDKTVDIEEKDEDSAKEGEAGEATDTDVELDEQKEASLDGADDENDELKQDMQELMQEYDEDGDGTLSLAEVGTTFAKAFQLADKNKDGKIDVTELPEAMKQFDIVNEQLDAVESEGHKV